MKIKLTINFKDSLILSTECDWFWIGFSKLKFKRNGLFTSVKLTDIQSFKVEYF